MKRLNTTWTSAFAVTATMLGCGSEETTGGLGPVTGNPSATAGTSAPPATSGTSAAAPAAAGTGVARAGTGAPPATGASGTGTSAAGTRATPPTSTGGTGASGTGAAGTSTAGAGAAVAGAPAVAGTGAPVAGTGGAAGGSAEPGVVTNCGTAEHTDQVKGPGPFMPTHIQNGGAGTSWVFYPKEIGKDGCKHPIFNWGPGAGTGPSQYTDHLNHLASHGFVIISQPSSGTGVTEKASLEWLIKQNDTMGSPFFQKLDTKKVVMGGHSMGALTTFAMADYAPLTHYILVCGGSFGAPTGADKIHGPTIILGGDTDTGTPNFEDDYDAIKSPVVFLIKSGTDHIACARNNLEPWTAFMRWQLYGETKWKPDFFMGGKYCKAPWDSCESKGW